MKHVIVIVALILGVLAATATAKCRCGKSAICLTDTQMAEHVEHIKMDDDLMGRHMNVSGIAVVEVVFGKDGRVVNARALSGHPLAIAHLIGAVPKWRFKPYLRDGVAQKACGTLRLKFSIVENVSNVQVERSAGGN